MLLKYWNSSAAFLEIWYNFKQLDYPVNRHSLVCEPGNDKEEREGGRRPAGNPGACLGMPVKSMCGRFVLVTDLKNIQKNFNIQDVLCEYQPSWNIVPSQLIPAVINHEGINRLVCFRWGLIPSWSKDPSIADGLINARAETVDKKPSFKDAFRKRRCLIVADGFYEWKKEGNRKMPLYYYLKSGRSFGFAGLYETWVSPDKKETKTCTIITTAANELIAPVHDRMPVILSNDQEKVWLESDANAIAGLKSILKPYPAEGMDSKPGIGPHKDNSQK